MLSYRHWKGEGKNFPYLVAPETVAVTQAHRFSAFSSHGVQAVVGAVIFNLQNNFISVLLRPCAIIFQPLQDSNNPGAFEIPDRYFQGTTWTICIVTSRGGLSWKTDPLFRHSEHLNKQ